MWDVLGVTQPPGRAGIKPPSPVLRAVTDPVEPRASCLQTWQTEDHSLPYVLKSLRHVSELRLRKPLIKG